MALTLTSARGARGQDAAGAQTLFDEARALMRAGKYAEAVPKLEESARLEPGVGTSFNLALCYERAGRLASAWVLFREVADATRVAHQADRERVARDRARVLEPRLSRLTLQVPAGAATPGLVVSRDGREVPPSLFDVAVPVDGGEHTIAARAPGRMPWRVALTLAPESDLRVLVVPPLELETASSAAGRGERSDGPPTSRRGAQATLGIVAMALAGAGLTAGFIAGGRALSDHQASQNHCVEDLCDATGAQLRSGALRAGDVATGTFVTAGILGAVGALLWLTAPRGSGGRRPDHALSGWTQGRWP